MGDKLGASPCHGMGGNQVFYELPLICYFTDARCVIVDIWKIKQSPHSQKPGWQATQLYKRFKVFELSNYRKTSHLSNSGLKIGNLS